VTWLIRMWNMAHSYIGHDFLAHSYIDSLMAHSYIGALMANSYIGSLIYWLTHVLAHS